PAPLRWAPPAGRTPPASEETSEDHLSTILIVLFVALKFALPLLLVPFPFFAGWANFVLDTIDGDILIPLGLSDPVYQNIDKSADCDTYVFTVMATWTWPI